MVAMVFAQYRIREVRQYAALYMKYLGAGRGADGVFFTLSQIVPLILRFWVDGCRTQLGA